MLRSVDSKSLGQDYGQCFERHRAPVDFLTCGYQHNGIEHGEMGVMGELVALLHDGLELSYGEIADILEKENTSGALKGNFLLDISHRILRTKKADGIDNPNGVVEDIEDSKPWEAA